MICSTTEYSTIQKPSIAFLKKLGYTYISPDEALSFRGGDLSNVLFKDILKEKLKELNTHDSSGNPINLSSDSIDKAIKELDVSLEKGLKEANRIVSDLLVYGTTTHTNRNDKQKSKDMRYIDFDNPNNNHFCVTEEFSTKRKFKDIEGATRRPDLVLFVNGIPFGVIELKKSGVDIEEGISQMIRNQDEKEIPHLFKFIQICIAGNNQKAKYGTIYTPIEFYSIWQEEQNQESLFLPQSYGITKPDALDKLFAALLHPKRVLEFISAFIIFDGKVKKIARHQQFFAIKETMKKIQSTKEASKRGGLIWHTQGSGKSLTMSILASLIKKAIPTSRIIVVTDRVDLDEQIHTTFGKTGIEAKRAKNGNHLIELLQKGESVITTLVQKFQAPEKHNIVINSQDIFLLVDESHRTQNGLLHNAMKDSIPNGCYIGFTGTPLTSKEKSSARKFGGFIHKYTIEQALRDKAILPLYYEGRFSEQFINDAINLDKKFEAIARDLSEEEKSHLKKETTKATLSSIQRLEWIAIDIEKHFEKNFKGTGFVAMFATSSKADAVAYHQLFKTHNVLKSAFVISSPDTRVGNTAVGEENEDEVIAEWRKILESYGSEENIIGDFEDGEIDLLIVVDKLLTGFDAPRVACLYLDKRLKEHNLLQAIARANRIYEGKERAYIIDYRGIHKAIDDAMRIYQELADFDKEDIKDVIFGIKDILKELRENHQRLKEFFAEIISQKERGKLQEIYEQFLEEKEKREEFYELLSLFARSLSALMIFPRFKESITNEECDTYKRDLKFYLNLKHSVQIRYHEKVDFKQYQSQIKNMIHQFIGAQEVRVILKLRSVVSEDFLNEIEEQPNDKAKADKIISAISQYIKENKESNPYFYDELSKQIQKVIDEYKEGRLSEKEKLSKLQSIRETLLNHQNHQENQYPKDLSTPPSRAFYDSIKGLIGDLDEEQIIKLAQQIDVIFIQKSKKPNWKNNQDVRNEIVDAIEELIFKEYKDASNEELDKLEEQFMLAGISHYGN
ncbi:hypothetical protein BBW65_00620 [Helicobacter enhydrae]|uniref:Type I restriction enzyme endonuclease subunit n=1 Tax=Helicobacter enhydrae TaxID=222136 RepID=A0A1B1U3S3_9HELI|nr:type I restriction endonuclease subunit R [Helicobacter enhydrae]ANV97410.1 hypothetical protein BBW65_00620 [Helicobacter enhydrae]